MKKKPLLAIITGLSGAGKTSSLKVLEDLGFFSIDNLPPPLIPEFLELLHSSKRSYDRAAVVIDIRSGEFFEGIFDTIKKARGVFKVVIIFLEADDETLINRFKVSRRPHPLGADMPLERAVLEERALLTPIRDMADVVIDTSVINIHQLRERLKGVFAGYFEDIFYLHFVSFSYSSGIPAESHLVFDVRFMPNPFFVPELKGMTGMDEKVKEFLYGSDVVRSFLEKTESLIDFLVPLYKNEGKTYLVVSFGCTGGMHRSVFAAEHFYKVYSSREGVSVKKIHRELGLDG